MSDNKDQFVSDEHAMAAGVVHGTVLSFLTQKHDTTNTTLTEITDRILHQDGPVMEVHMFGRVYRITVEEVDA